MIKRKFQTYSNGEPYGEPWHKEFKDEEEMRQWQRSQDGHAQLIRCQDQISQTVKSRMKHY